MSGIKFWNSDGRVEPTLYSSQAETLAKTIASDNEQSRGKRVNKRTQIRKFYDEVVRLDMESRKLDLEKTADAARWGDILPLVHMLVAKAAYAKGRELVSDDFTNFIRYSIEQVENPKDLNVFANFFEAFMGFYRLHGPAS